MAKGRVSITVWKTWKGSHHYTPSHIHHHEQNLHFGKEDYFHVLVFCTGYFIKEIENFFPVFPYVIETLVEVWENSKLRGNTCPTGSCSHFNFSFSQISTRVSVTVWKHGKCFLFLKSKVMNKHEISCIDILLEE